MLIPSETEEYIQLKNETEEFNFFASQNKMTGMIVMWTENKQGKEIEQKRIFPKELYPKNPTPLIAALHQIAYLTQGE